jgi:hypothetical protein
VRLDSRNYVESAIRERQCSYRTLYDLDSPGLDRMGIRMSRDCDARWREVQPDDPAVRGQGLESLGRPPAAAANVQGKHHMNPTMPAAKCGA